MYLQSTKSSSFNKNKGISLIELMVSMTIGLGLIAGMMSMYVGSLETDKTRTELSDIEANARVALRYLRQTIEHAGYRSVESISAFQKPFYSKIDGAIDGTLKCRDTKSLVVSPGLITPPTELEDFTKDGTNGDAITITYLADDPNSGDIFTDCAGGDYSKAGLSKTAVQARLTACSTDTAHPLEAGDTAQGMTVPIDAKIYSGFFLKALSGKPKQLVCYGSRSYSDTPQVIADNIDNMQILYGVIDATGTKYKTATDVENNNEWSSVISARVAILVASSKSKVIENPRQRSFTLLDQTVTKDSNDQRMYKVYTTTISLQNRITRGL